MFIRCLWRWFNIKIKVLPIKSKAQKLLEMEDFQVSGLKNLNENLFDDSDIMEKSAEELFEEDMMKTEEQLKKEIEEREGRNISE